MKILKFIAENVKGIKVITLDPQGKDVTLSGKNGAGKSSVLDSIEKTLCGGKLLLRKGTEKGCVEIDIGDYKVSRVITQKTDRLIIKNKEGAIFPEPRTMLSKLIGNLSINPLLFVNLKPREQVDSLFQLVPGLEEKLEDNERQMEIVKNERSDVLALGRRVKMELEDLGTSEGAPESSIDLEGLIETLNGIVEQNQKNEERRRLLRTKESSIEKLASQIETSENKVIELQAKIKDITDTIRDKTKEMEKHQKELNDIGDIPEDQSTAEVQEQLSSAHEINENYKQAQLIKSKEKERIDLQKKYAGLGEDMKRIEKEKADLLSNSSMPIDCLSVEDGCVSYKGVIVDELSTSEKIRVGASIAVAQNPKARIILVDDVSLLDSENLAILHEVCKGFQIWQVVNDSTGKVGVYIEDGTIG